MRKFASLLATAALTTGVLAVTVAPASAAATTGTLSAQPALAAPVSPTRSTVSSASRMPSGSPPSSRRTVSPESPSSASSCASRNSPPAGGSTSRRRRSRPPSRPERLAQLLLHPGLDDQARRERCQLPRGLAGPLLQRLPGRLQHAGRLRDLQLTAPTQPGPSALVEPAPFGGAGTGRTRSRSPSHKPAPASLRARPRVDRYRPAGVNRSRPPRREGRLGWGSVRARASAMLVNPPGGSGTSRRMRSSLLLIVFDRLMIRSAVNSCGSGVNREAMAATSPGGTGGNAPRPDEARGRPRRPSTARRRWAARHWISRRPRAEVAHWSAAAVR